MPLLIFASYKNTSCIFIKCDENLNKKKTLRTNAQSLLKIEWMLSTCQCRLILTEGFKYQAIDDNR